MHLKGSVTACIQCLTQLPANVRVCPNCRALQPARTLETVAPGATIDLGYARVVVDARVGSGGMGVVWRGWLFHSPTGPRATDPPEAIALKVLRPEVQIRNQLRAFFVNEAATLKRLSHPNIVRFHELFEWGPSLVLAIEYVDGDTLEAVIARHVARGKLAGGGALPGMAFRRSWYYFQQLLGALAAVHALGIVHRDVKPSNVLIRQDGIVKLTDFGIASNAAHPGVVAAPEGDLAPGTSLYMSPEQVLSRPLDGRSDLYSAAVVLYEMLSGRTPFAGDRSDFIIRQDHVEKTPPPIRTYLAQAPPAIDALFARALAKDPAMRFANAIEMGNAFRTGLGLADSAEWRAQGDIAREAVHVAPSTSVDDRASMTGGSGVHEKRLATLREFVVRGYRTAKMASM
jgi:serine/threonine-protein kinase